MKMTQRLMILTVSSESSVKWRKRCIYLQSFQEEEFLRTECFLINKKSTFLHFEFTELLVTVTLQMIIFSSVLATATKTAAMLVGKGSLAVGHAFVIALK